MLFYNKEKKFYAGKTTCSTNKPQVFLQFYVILFS